MPRPCDILIFGTGSFAQRIACDIAATAGEPTHLVIAGRNILRLAWIGTAARARADMFGRPVEVETTAIDLDGSAAAPDLLGRLQPTVIVQAASFQTGSVIAGGGNAWASLVAEGGLSASAVFQALLTSRIARATQQVSRQSFLINCCFPDVANGIVAAMGLPVACGIGNIQILSHAFSGMLDGTPKPELRMLCHYQNIGPWRRPPTERIGPPPRVWLGGTEIGDVHARFRVLQLTPEPVIDISGASGVTLMLAAAHGRPWRGHVPGPAGLPGGYPVVLDKSRIELDLPAGLRRDEAIRWNVAHEQMNGLVIENGGRARYTGKLHERLAKESAELAAGFAVNDLEAVCQSMGALRDRLQQRAA